VQPSSADGDYRWGSSITKAGRSSPLFSEAGRSCQAGWPHVTSTGPVWACLYRQGGHRLQWTGPESNAEAHHLYTLASWSKAT
jgi:hypothetical protein